MRVLEKTLRRSLRDVFKQLSSQAFGFEQVVGHVVAERLGNARALQLPQGVVRGPADDELEVPAL